MNRPDDDAMCECGYRGRFHEGKKMTCVVAGAKCDGFRLNKQPEFEEAKK